MYGQAGIPDIIACIDGKFVALEVKTPSGKLTMLQESTLSKINAAKGTALKVTSLQEVKAVIRNLND
jgi:Holliday junction resolvase